VLPYKNNPDTILKDGTKEQSMDTLEKYHLEFLLRNNVRTRLSTPSAGRTETTINIQASDDWVVTGTYADNQLQKFSLKKVDYQNKEATDYGRD
jgi:hypothetical protein